MKSKIQTHRDLLVYQRAFENAMQLYALSKEFPREELYSLTDQMRRSSRSACGNLAEEWRKRRYPAAFASKLSDCEGEVAEAQVWIEFAVKCGYLARSPAAGLYRGYDEILRMIVAMINRPEAWIIGNGQRPTRNKSSERRT